MGACRVEGTQAAGTHPVNFIHPVEQALDHGLAFTVWAARNDLFILFDRDRFGRVKQRGGGRQNKASDAVLGGGFEQVGGGDHIVTQILERLLHTFRDDNVGSKVENAVELMCVEKLCQCGAVHQVANHE